MKGNVHFMWIYWKTKIFFLLIDTKEGLKDQCYLLISKLEEYVMSGFIRTVGGETKLYLGSNQTLHLI